MARISSFLIQTLLLVSYLQIQHVFCVSYSYDYATEPEEDCGPEYVNTQTLPNDFEEVVVQERPLRGYVENPRPKFQTQYFYVVEPTPRRLPVRKPTPVRVFRDHVEYRQFPPQAPPPPLPSSSFRPTAMGVFDDNDLC